MDLKILESSDMIKKAIDEAGVDKIVFGSDSFNDEEFQRELKKTKVLNLTNKEKGLIMGENLARILKLTH